MAGNKEGAEKVKRKRIQQLGSLKAYKAYMETLGAKGGHAKVPKGFSVTKKKVTPEEVSREDDQPVIPSL